LHLVFSREGGLPTRSFSPPRLPSFFSRCLPSGSRRPPLFFPFGLPFSFLSFLFFFPRVFCFPPPFFIFFVAFREKYCPFFQFFLSNPPSPSRFQVIEFFSTPFGCFPTAFFRFGHTRETAFSRMPARPNTLVFSHRSSPLACFPLFAIYPGMVLYLRVLLSCFPSPFSLFPVVFPCVLCLFFSSLLTIGSQPRVSFPLPFSFQQDPPKIRASTSVIGLFFRRSVPILCFSRALDISLSYFFSIPCVPFFFPPSAVTPYGRFFRVRGSASDPRPPKSPFKVFPSLSFPLFFFVGFNPDVSNFFSGLLHPPFQPFVGPTFSLPPPFSPPCQMLTGFFYFSFVLRHVFRCFSDAAHVTLPPPLSSPLADDPLFSPSASCHRFFY